MFVIDVIPFARSAPLGALSYRARKWFAVGSLVSVPLRKKIVTGIVVSCIPVREAKAELKAATFALRSGAPDLIGKLPNAYQDTGAAVATYHAVPLARVFRAILPEAAVTTGFPRLARGLGARHIFIEAPYLKRLAAYKRRVGRAPHSSSVLFVVPTTIEARRLARTFTDAVVITGELSPRVREAILPRALNAPVVITTPHYSLIPIARLSAIIIERESAAAYVAVRHPQLDWRVVLRIFAQTRKVPLIYGDYPLRLETRPVPEAHLDETPHNIEIVDTLPKKDAQTRSTFAAIPKPLMKELERTVSSGGRAIVCAVRRGYAPTVVCHDCGTTLRDSRGRSLTLATVNGKRVLRSADGYILKGADALCDVCGSWNLVPLGIGVERVVEEVSRTLPQTPYVRFDADTIKTPAAARRAAANFSKPGTIIIGTEAVLPWLSPREPLSLAIIASADTLLALPFWRARERFIRLAFSLAERSERLLVATRRKDDAACLALDETHAKSFFTEESSIRATLHYPPYAHVLVVHIRGTNPRLEKDEEIIRKLFEPNILTRIPDRAVTEQHHSLFVRTLVAKINWDEWPNARISANLQTLPHNISVAIDSESLW